MGFHNTTKGALEGIDVDLEESIGHPCDAKHGEHSGHTGLEHGSVGDLARFGLAENEDEGTGDQHDHLDDQVHGQRLHTLLTFEGRAQLFECTEDHDDADGDEEGPHGTEGLLREDLAEQRLRGGVHHLLELWILHALLERLVLVQVLAAAQRPQRGQKHTGEGSRNSDHQDLWDGVGLVDHASFLSQDRCQGDRSDRHRRGGDAHLRACRRHSHRTLGTNTLLDCDVLDDREHGVHDVAGAAEHGEEPGGQWRQDGDHLWLLAQQFLRVLHHHVQTTCLLQGEGAADHGDDGEHDVDGRFARFDTEEEHHDEQAKAGNQAEADAAVAGAEEKAEEDDCDLEDDRNR